MSFENYVKKFAGFSIEQYEPGKPIKGKKKAVRVVLSCDDYFENGTVPDGYYAEFFDSEGLENVQALIFGCWNFEGDGEVTMITKPLIKNASKLPNLKALFLGDVISEDCEVSWLEMGNVSKLWKAFPQLEVLWIRGSNNLSLGKIQHENLRELVLQSGGLPKTVVAEVCKANLPNLEHLELWLGIDNYGGDTTIEDLQPILDGKAFPKLKFLGLKNSERQDEIAKAMVDAPVLPQLEELDLSDGTLGDVGAEALLASRQKFAHLNKLDLRHHYMSNAMMERMREMPCETLVSGQEKEDVYDGETYRYVSVDE